MTKDCSWRDPILDVKNNAITQWGKKKQKMKIMTSLLKCLSFGVLRGVIIHIWRGEKKLPENVSSCPCLTVWEKGRPAAFSRRFKHADHAGRTNSLGVHASEGRSRFELQRRRCDKVKRRLGRWYLCRPVKWWAQSFRNNHTNALPHEHTLLDLCSIRLSSSFVILKSATKASVLISSALPSGLQRPGFHPSEMR